MPVQEWLKFPRVLFVWLYTLFGLSAFTVLWLGQTLIERDRTQRDQLRRQELDQVAEQQVSAYRTYVAETSERVARWAQQAQGQAVPGNSVLMLGTSVNVRVHPVGRILYLPLRSNGIENSPDVFRGAEALEFRRETASQAEDQYRKLARSPQVEVRAGALLRLGRVLVSSGQSAEALAVYQQLGGMSATEVAGAPAELIARHTRLRLLDAPQRQLEAGKLRTDLAAAHWQLARGQFEFFWKEVNAAAGTATSAPDISKARALSEAAHEGYKIAMQKSDGQGQRSIWVADEPWFLMWRTGSAGLAVYVTATYSILPAAPGILVSLRDGEGRRVAGIEFDGRGAALRASVDTGLPWTIAVARDPKDAITAARSPLLLILLAVMFAFLATGTYFIARAIRREIETARLQSDFVAAVSHEFRSPLTTIRSLSEMLHADRILDQNRAQYYKTLVTESTRLQRLVETLLNFGRMDSGHRHFQFENIDATELVRDVVSGFPASGRRIEIRGDSTIHLLADREAVGVAVRNLIDNAIRYSPAAQPVEVTLTRQGNQLLISVKDHGPGVEGKERDAIFQKFVRGSAAANGNVRGTGVGLALVRQIAEAHHGKIHLESYAGNGSTFTLAIPLEQNL